MQTIEDRQLADALRGGGGSPIVRTPAHWQDQQRTTEGKVIDPAALAEWEAAQAEAQASAGAMARSKAEAEAKALDLQKGASEKENEIEARKGAAARKSQEEQYKIEADLESQRKALENPQRDFWDGEGTAGQVAAAIAVALGNAADALRGGQGNAASVALQQAMDRHVGNRERQITLLERQRGRSKEAAADTQARLEAERVTALRQIDDQVKQTLAAGQNPVLRELVMEDVPPSEAKKAAAVAIVRNLRRAIPGANEDPADIQKSADEYIRTMTPQEKRIVFTEGPNGELVPKENVTFVAAKHAENMARLEAARERLGYADKLAATQRLAQAWMPERVTGGGGGPNLDKAKKILLDRIARGDKAAEADLKRMEVTGKIEERGEQREEKAGARTFLLGGQEYVARPGTSPEAVRSFQDKASLLSSAQKAAAEIKNTNWAANKAGSKDLDVNVRSLAAAANTLYGQGAMTSDDLNWFNDTLKNTNWTTADGKAAAQKIVQRLEDVQRGWVSQVGAKPKGAR